MKAVKLKVFAVTYDGLTLGGRAMVIAENESQAAELVQARQETFGFENVKVRFVLNADEAGLLFNDPG